MHVEMSKENAEQSLNQHVLENNLQTFTQSAGRVVPRKDQVFGRELMPVAYTGRPEAGRHCPWGYPSTYAINRRTD